MVIFKNFKFLRLEEILTFLLAKGKTIQSTLLGPNEEWKYPIAPKVETIKVI